MDPSEQLRELAESLKVLFEEKRGNFRKDDFITVAGLLGFDAYEKMPSHKAPKPIAKNYFADMVGINLKHSLETYEWEEWRPLTDDGITISGFWKSEKTKELPTDYAMDASGQYLRRVHKK